MTLSKPKRLQIIGITNSVVSLFMAAQSWSAFEATNYGNALIFVGGALASALIPFSQFDPKMFRQPIGELADQATRSLPSLRFRLAMGLAWLLIFCGCASFFL